MKTIVTLSLDLEPLQIVKANLPPRGFSDYINNILRAESGIIDTKDEKDKINVLRSINSRLVTSLESTREELEILKRDYEKLKESPPVLEKQTELKPDVAKCKNCGGVLIPVRDNHYNKAGVCKPCYISANLKTIRVWENGTV